MHRETDMRTWEVFARGSKGMTEGKGWDVGIRQRIEIYILFLNCGDEKGSVLLLPLDICGDCLPKMLDSWSAEGLDKHAKSPSIHCN